MTTNIAPQPVSRQKLAIEKASAKKQVTGALKVACDDMIQTGKRWDQAALDAGLAVRSLRLAMQKPHVLKYLKDERALFLTTLNLANPTALAGIRDKGKNDAARVRAVATLEEMAGTIANQHPGQATVPGVVVQIINGPPEPAERPGHTITITPNARPSEAPDYFVADNDANEFPDA